MKHPFKRSLFGVSLALSCWLCSVAYVVSAEAEPPIDLAQAVDAALQPGLTGQARVAVRIVDADTGEVLLETPNAAEPFIPASNLKLITSATALDRYGPDFELSTTLALRGDDLWIIGGGDPALGDERIAEKHGETQMSVFDTWADRIKDREVTEILGDLIVCDPVFDDQLVHPTWASGNLLHWYGAPVAGVSFNDNCVDINYRPAELGEPAEIEAFPAAGGFEIVNQAVSVAEDEHDARLVKRAGEVVYELTGKVGREGGNSKPCDDPRRFLGEVAKAALAERGVNVQGQVVVRTDNPTSDEWIELAAHATAFTDVLGRVNTNSQNMMAEALAKLNGLHHDQQNGVENPRGSWGSGHLAAAAFLSAAGIDTTSLVAADGSGLSRENRVTAVMISDLLLHMLREHEHSEHYVGSMAISGVRGSVRSRMRELEGKVYAKTGTIRSVSALSGYVFHDSGRVLVFSILHNGFEGSQGPYRAQQDDAVRAMWKWLDAQPAFHEPDVRPEAMREALEVVGR